MKIILFMIDALRIDHLSATGYHRNTTPNIDKLAKDGTFFINTYTVLPNSDPAVTSMLTGLYPSSHGVRKVYNNRLDFSITTLPEILQSHGYKTASMKAGIPYPPGVERGFDDYNNLTWKIENKIKRGIYKIFNPKNFISVSQQYTDMGIRWIKKNSNKNFFIIFHFIDLHWPYIIPKPYDDTFDPNYKGKHDFADLRKGSILRGNLIFGKVKLPEAEVNHVIAHYDGGIKLIDTQIGKILNFLEKNGLDEETIMVLVSDHGECFGEHNFYFQHGNCIYEPSLKVPMIFKNSKRIPKNKIIKTPVQTVDIMPTILDFLKIPILDKIDGVSLLPLIEGKNEKLREYIFVESSENIFEENERSYFEGVKGKWRAIVKDNWKLLYGPHPKEEIFELYDLKSDPEEKNNLIVKENTIATKLKKKLFDILKPQSQEGKTVLTEKSRKLLRKMGYAD